MRVPKSLVVVALALAGACIGNSIRAEDAKQDTGYWVTTSGSLKISEAWRAGMVVQTRSQDDLSHLERTVLRPSLSYNVVGKTWLTAGYDAHFIELPTDRLEQRAWQQFLTIWPASFASLSARIRLEERFIENVDGTALRLRLKGRADFPIEGTEWKITASNEYFVGLNDLEAGPKAGFDQNRAYLGVARPLTDFLSVKLGYQMQYVNRNAAADSMIHQLMIGVSIN